MLLTLKWDGDIMGFTCDLCDVSISDEINVDSEYVELPKASMVALLCDDCIEAITDC